jgi:hypothetical protein
MHNYRGNRLLESSVEQARKEKLIHQKLTSDPQHFNSNYTDWELSWPKARPKHNQNLSIPVLMIEALDPRFFFKTDSSKYGEILGSN